LVVVDAVVYSHEHFGRVSEMDGGGGGASVARCYDRNFLHLVPTFVHERRRVCLCLGRLYPDPVDIVGVGALRMAAEVIEGRSLPGVYEE
jgi:hypothetical protein